MTQRGQAPKRLASATEPSQAAESPHQGLLGEAEFHCRSGTSATQFEDPSCAIREFEIALGYLRRYAGSRQRLPAAPSPTDYGEMLRRAKIWTEAEAESRAGTKAVACGDVENGLRHLQLALARLRTL